MTATTRRAPMVDRRSALQSCATAPAVSAALAGSAAGVSTQADSIERRSGGRLCLLALDLETGRTLLHRADEPFKLYSTSKLLLAARVLSEVASGRQSLNARVRY